MKSLLGKNDHRFMITIWNEVLNKYLVLSRVKELTSELEQLRQKKDSEQLTLKGENAVLKDATRRLNSEIASTKRELKLAVEQGQTAERSRAEIQKVSPFTTYVVLDLLLTLVL